MEVAGENKCLDGNGGITGAIELALVHLTGLLPGQLLKALSMLRVEVSFLFLDLNDYNKSPIYRT